MRLNKKNIFSLNKKPWLVNYPDHEISHIFFKNLKLKSNRRDFLKFIGFSFSALALTTACKNKKVRSLLSHIPVKQNKHFYQAKWYTSTCMACSAGCPVLVKVINDKPVKIEGNPESSMSKGGLCASGQACLYNLYDKKNSINGPMADNAPAEWDAVDELIINQLKAVSGKKGKIVILSGTINSPSTLQIISDFSDYYGNAEHIQFEPLSSYAIKKSFERCFGKKILPSYYFNKARTIVSFGADFLNTWISPVEYTANYMINRDIDNKREMSWHVQVESVLTITGARADKRVIVNPSEEGLFLIGLYNKLAGFAGKPALSNNDFHGFEEEINETALRLWYDRGKSIVIGNSNFLPHQMIINGINSLLGNFGRTIDLDNISFQKEGDDEEYIELINRMKRKEIEALLLYDSDTAYSFPLASEFMNALMNVPLRISINRSGLTSIPSTDDSTKQQFKFICPDKHFLESWNDLKPKNGYYSISQPAINFNQKTRQAQQSLLKWGENSISYFDYIRNYWKKNIFTDQEKFNDFDTFWNHVLAKGVLEIPGKSIEKYNFDLYLEPEANKILGERNRDNSIELIVYESVVARFGKRSGNPLLLELPDPVSKICWNNYASVSPSFAEKHSLKNNDVIEINNLKEHCYAVHIQLGQADNTIAIPVGNKSIISMKGPAKYSNIFDLAGIKDKIIQYATQRAGYTVNHNHYILAKTEIAAVIKNSVPVPEYSVNEFLKLPFPAEDNPERFYAKSRKFYPHHWGLVIDLNLCTGCSACIVSCMVENNISVVGQKQVQKRREMFWLRIDRYYYHSNHKELKVGFIPVLCQHCSNAPCEAVCPVSATTGSSEGINQQIYQRCIGSRYCASNCPYQVRKFNFYDYFNDREYQQYNSIRKEFLNPGVSIREKGVIEKCSMCLQRIQEAKNKAKTGNSILADGEIRMACEQSCPAGAISFGDMNDKSSRVYSLIQSKRAFRLLPELETSPSVIYLARVRNLNEINII